MNMNPLSAIGLSIQGANRRGYGLTACLQGRVGLPEAVLVTVSPKLPCCR